MHIGLLVPAGSNLTYPPSWGGHWDRAPSKRHRCRFVAPSEVFSTQTSHSETLPSSLTPSLRAHQARGGDLEDAAERTRSHSAVTAPQSLSPIASQESSFAGDLCAKYILSRKVFVSLGILGKFLNLFSPQDIHGQNGDVAKLHCTGLLWELSECCEVFKLVPGVRRAS